MFGKYYPRPISGWQEVASFYKEVEFEQLSRRRNWELVFLTCQDSDHAGTANALKTIKNYSLIAPVSTPKQQPKRKKQENAC